MTDPDGGGERQPQRPRWPRAVILGVAVLATFGLLVVVKSRTDAANPAAGARSGAAISLRRGAATPTSRRSDASADYEAALTTGKPVYVLFHSVS